MTHPVSIVFVDKFQKVVYKISISVYKWGIYVDKEEEVSDKTEHTEA